MHRPDRGSGRARPRSPGRLLAAVTIVGLLWLVGPAALAARAEAATFTQHLEDVVIQTVHEPNPWSGSLGTFTLTAAHGVFSSTTTANGTSGTFSAEGTGTFVPDAAEQRDLGHVYVAATNRDPHQHVLCPDPPERWLNGGLPRDGSHDLQRRRHWWGQLRQDRSALWVGISLRRAMAFRHRPYGSNREVRCTLILGSCGCW